MRCEGNPSTMVPPACSRCHRLKIPCVFSAPFKRTHKRKRVEELEEEITALKKQLFYASPAASVIGLPSQDTSSSRQEEDISVSPWPTAKDRVARRTELLADRDPTLSRAINGLDLASNIIDECFRLYFELFHSILPVLDPTILPNTLYSQDPLLFWAVVSIGSRQFIRQPSLTGALAQPVTQFALQSMIIPTKSIEHVKALLLLLNWPFPTGPFNRDPSFLLSGLVLHLAMQCGLHTPAFSQEFSKTYQVVPEQEPIRMAELWTYVVIIYQRTCSGSGQADMASFEIYNEQTHFQNLLEGLPMTLKRQLKISTIVTRAHKALLDVGLLSMTSQQERTMDVVLKGFTTELDSIEDPASSVWDRFYISAARQALAAMHFYKSAATLDLQSSILIFNATSTFLEQLRDLDRDHSLHRICTRFILTTTTESLANMARILRGPFAEHLDQAHGHSLFSISTWFVQSCSIQKGDYADRVAAFADKLWKSKKVFRNPDGSINITLRMRNRLSGAPLQDVIRCWKAEFFGPELMQSASEMGNDMAAPPSSNTRVDTMLTPSPGNTGALSDLPALSEGLLIDDIWGDLDLGLSDNWMMAGSNSNWMT